MLSIIHKKAYQDFLDLLAKLQSDRTAFGQSRDCYGFDFPASTIHKDPIWQELVAIFQHRIITLTDEELETEVASRWISLQTEIQRGFRLLQTEWLFWQSARQPATRKAKEASVREQLQKLIDYCQAMLTL